MPRRLLLRLIGSFELALRKPPRTLRFSTKKAEALFAYLALSDSPVRRDMLGALLWGDVPIVQARHSLRQALTEIRSTLRAHGEHFIQTTRFTVALNPDSVRVDVLSIERLLRRGSPQALELACALSGADLLAGIAVSEPAFERWLMTTRAKVKQLAIEAHERYLETLIARHQNEEAIQTALRLVALDVLHERAHRTLMDLYAAQGQLSAALRQYDLCARYLAHELGVEPAPETQRMREALLSMRSEAAESERWRGPVRKKSR